MAEGDEQQLPDQASAGPEAYARTRATGAEAGVSAMRLRLRRLEGTSQLDGSLLSASASVSADKAEIAAHLGRLSGAGQVGEFRWQSTIEVLSAHASAALLNPDGSRGLHSRLGAALLGTETTASYAGNSVTLGASLGLSAGASAGLRDADGDGRLEACARVETPLVTVGLCVENPF
ncbi:MAG: hypothetical protein IPL40_07600 [Proteobacteria bacterium]|nr:hypothetical protein [Pseudomonadota bacterium]